MTAAALDSAPDLADLRELGGDRDSTLVDVGAGTGTLAVAAAPVCRRAVAVDISPSMVDAVRARAAELRLTNVDVVQAGFLTRPSAKRTCATSSAPSAGCWHRCSSGRASRWGGRTFGPESTPITSPEG